MIYFAIYENCISSGTEKAFRSKQTQQQRASIALRLWSLTKINKQNKTKPTIFVKKWLILGLGQKN